MSNISAVDKKFMDLALSLAKKAQGNTTPNPMVGAVIVKNGKIIAKGYHKKCGLAHAEIEAIEKINPARLKGASIYINLEPCSYSGRTPPCVDAIIKNKFKKVVIALNDPNPKVSGASIRKLKKSKIQVEVGLCKNEAVKLNEVFFKNMKSNSPFVVTKVAQSLDGKIATYKGESKWITSKKTRDFAKTLRDKYDSVLVGANTILKDDPRLNGKRRVPFKVIIDPDLRISPKSYILKVYPQKVIIFASSLSRKLAGKIPTEAKVFFLKKNAEGWLSLRQVMKILFKLGIMSVFVEGGSKTLGRFFDQRLVDKAYFFIAPKIIGGEKSLASIGAEGARKLDQAGYLKNLKVKQIGNDLCIWGYPNDR